eukprot:1103477-Pelagomonas_calceolata.AAC.4
MSKDACKHAEQAAPYLEEMFVDGEQCPLTSLRQHAGYRVKEGLQSKRLTASLFIEGKKFINTDVGVAKTVHSLLRGPFVNLDPSVLQLRWQLLQLQYSMLECAR